MASPQILRTVRDGLLYAPLGGDDKLERARHQLLASLAYKAEYRSATVTRHPQRVGHLSAQLATKLGIPRSDAELLRRAAPLHDVGAIAIPEAILLKPQPLTAEEFAIVQTHPEIGAEMLSNTSSALVRTAQQIALTHHERFDGLGYPRRLAGNAIPLVGQIVSVVDILDTLTSRRPYKPAWPVADALRELERQGGKQVNPRLVTAMRQLLREEGVLAPAKRSAYNHIYVRGSFQTISLIALLQLITRRQRSLRLVSFCRLSKGEGLIYKGELVHMSFEGFSGEQALLQMAIETLLCPDAHFTVEAWQVAHLPEALVNINEALEPLLHKIAVALKQLGLAVL